uniref:Uncharacterized protein n=1 Tax=Syphacia muris TaxID=451379 RepID=A0A0N5B190_9BILA
MAQMLAAHSLIPQRTAPTNNLLMNGKKGIEAIVEQEKEKKEKEEAEKEEEREEEEEEEGEKECWCCCCGSDDGC